MAVTIELKRRGIKKRPLKALTESEEIALIDHYLSGGTLKGTGKEFGLSDMGCKRYLERNGIARRGNDAYKRYPFNESFFETIDTEAKAYFLGLITGDGNISGSAISIFIFEDDKSVGEKFLECIGCEGGDDRIFRSKTSRMWTVIVWSKRMGADLAKYGVVPNKTFTVTPWTAPRGRDDLQAAYWRGCIDSDGCVTRHKATGAYHIGFCGNQEMAEGFRAFAQEVCGTRTKARRHDNSYTVTIMGKSVAARLATALYENATVFVERKKKVADESIHTMAYHAKRPDVTTEMILADLQSGLNQPAIAKKYGMTFGAINHRVRAAKKRGG
ncbi:hypothetical protein EON83_17220 [bacterium]|nr:MAG: hypothetical protein EON83_17220 [bacterium]